MARARLPPSLRDLHQLPPVRASRVLQGVVAAETAWHALHELPDADVLDLVRQDIATWEVDDPGLAALHARIVEAPQREDLVELRRRAPYG